VKPFIITTTITIIVVEAYSFAVSSIITTLKSFAALLSANLDQLQ
jgi:hypothetical protein